MTEPINASTAAAQQHELELAHYDESPEHRPLDMVTGKRKKAVYRWYYHPGDDKGSERLMRVPAKFVSSQSRDDEEEIRDHYEKRGFRRLRGKAITEAVKAQIERNNKADHERAAQQAEQDDIAKKMPGALANLVMGESRKAAARGK